MKKIEAIIRKTRFEDVRESLEAAGIEWFSYNDVRGIGKARESRMYRGVIYDTSCIERIMLHVIVRDINVDTTIKAIRDAAYTGAVGDGRIFVLNVDDAISIRSNVRGEHTLFSPQQDTAKKQPYN